MYDNKSFVGRSLYSAGSKIMAAQLFCGWKKGELQHRPDSFCSYSFNAEVENWQTGTSDSLKHINLRAKPSIWG